MVAIAQERRRWAVEAVDKAPAGPIMLGLKIFLGFFYF
jgi:hypothetical protein